MLSSGDGRCYVALGGSDLVYGSSGSSGATLVAGDGSDNVSVGIASGPHKIFGGSGQDAIAGGIDADFIVGGPGGDNLSGGSGDDQIFGGGYLADANDHPNNVSGGPGNDLLQAGGGGDLLSGGPGDDELGGGGGADQLYGDDGNDVIRPGGGPDQVYGGAGDDRVLLTSGCEIAAGMSIDGGPGFDVLESVLTAAELSAAGVTWTSIEEFRVVDATDCNGKGSCVADGDATCDCDPGYAGEFCQSCAEGFHFEGPSGSGLNLSDAVNLEDADGTSLTELGVQCVGNTDCSSLSCGAHGTCNDEDGTAFCQCDDGFIGDDCDACGALYDEVGGDCVLSTTCRDDLCSSHGRCVRDEAQDMLACQCDPGYFGSICEHRGIEFAPEADYVEEGHSVVLDVALFGPDCPMAPTSWHVDQGPGRIEYIAGIPHLTIDPGELDPADPVVYTTVVGDDIPPVCDDDEEIEGEIPSIPSGGIPLTGSTSKPMKDIDRLVLDYMRGLDEAYGISLAITHEGRVVYARGFGHEDASRTRALASTALMRIGSMSKALTVAAARELEDTSSDFDLSAPLLETLSDNALADDLRDSFGLRETQSGGFEFFDPNDPVDIEKVRRSRHDWRIVNGEKLSWLQRRAIAISYDLRLDACFAGDGNEIDPVWLDMTGFDIVYHRMGFDYRVWRDSDLQNGRSFALKNQYLGHSPPVERNDFLALAFRMCTVFDPGKNDDGSDNVIAGGYSNIGYNMLGETVRIVASEHFGGQLDMSEVVKKLVFDADFDEGDEVDMALGHMVNRRPREPEYITEPDREDRTRYQGDCGGKTPAACRPGEWELDGPKISWADGGHLLIEERPGSGGWLSTASQYARFQHRYDARGRRWNGKRHANGGHIPGAKGEGRWLPARHVSDSGDLIELHGRATFTLLANDDLEDGGDQLHDLAKLIEAALVDRPRSLWESRIQWTYSVCGDGVISGSETCDPAHPHVFREDNDSCQARGFPTGNLDCAACQVDTSDCGGTIPPGTP